MYKGEYFGTLSIIFLEQASIRAILHTNQHKVTNLWYIIIVLPFAQTNVKGPAGQRYLQKSNSPNLLNH